ncbi:hypothetical protein EIP86_005307 [Pleurotus ostreatoroseus]|nr:hypothetical protein EIP86_005307 [Pleurotus ostreatoroseus]
MHGRDCAVQEGHEIALFLECFIRANDVPPLEEVGEDGGKRMIGAVAVDRAGLFAHLASLEHESRKLLERYRTIVYLAADGVYHPLRDTSLSLEEHGKVFLSFVPEPGDNSSPRFPAVNRMAPAELASATHFTALASNLALRYRRGGRKHWTRGAIL